MRVKRSIAAVTFGLWLAMFVPGQAEAWNYCSNEGGQPPDEVTVRQQVPVAGFVFAGADTNYNGNGFYLACVETGGPISVNEGVGVKFDGSGATQPGDYVKVQRCNPECTDVHHQDLP
ncbi:MAG TPA: hypothetical protein VNE62_04390 [Actinomycetota bacterium]|nr:hypothetical protein [Actinomycetota bacterium]